MRSASNSSSTKSVGTPPFSNQEVKRPADQHKAENFSSLCSSPTRLDGTFPASQIKRSQNLRPRNPPVTFAFGFIITIFRKIMWPLQQSTKQLQGLGNVGTFKTPKNLEKTDSMDGL